MKNITLVEEDCFRFEVNC